MANAVNVNALRGILVHDTRINANSFDESSSTYTQAGAAPGVPVAGRETAMTLETAGATSDGSTITLQTVRAGGVSASPDGQIEPGAFAMRTNGTNWLGWNGPLVFSGWGPLHTFASGAAANQYGSLHAIHTSDGTLLTAANRFTSLGLTSALVILRTVGASTSTVVIDTQLTALATYRPALVPLPDGKILLLSTKTIASDQYTIRAWVSDDDGTTWTQSANSVIRDELDGTLQAPRRLRAAYANGQVLMLLSYRDNTAVIADSFRQYASADNGFSFALVQSVDNTTADNEYTGGAHDIVANSLGTFLVVFCGSSFIRWGGNSAVAYKVLPSAWTRWETVPTIELDALTAPSASLTAGGALANSTELCAARDEDGTAYVFSVDFSTGQQTQIAKTTVDIFQEFIAVGVPSITIPNVAFSAGGQEWSVGTLTAYAGTLRLVSAWDSPTWPGQVGVTAFAGYATACMPWTPATECTSDRLLGSRLTWLPYWLPNSAGWTLATVGAPTVTLNAGGYLNINTGASTVNNYTQAGPAITTGHTVAAFAEWSSNTGTSQLRLASSNGTQSYGLRVSYAGTTVSVLDAVSGGTIATTSVPAAAVIQVRAFLENDGATGRAVVYVGTGIGGFVTLRPSLRVANTAALTNGGVVAAATSVTWGNFALVAPGDSNWYAVGWNAATSASSVYNLALPDGLPGRPFSSNMQTLDFGTTVRALSGPTTAGDTWTIEPRHTYGVANVLPAVAPSPRQPWRSTGTTQQILAWSTELTALSTSPLRGPLGALYLGGCNFRVATLEGRTGPGAYTTIGVIDMSAEASSLRWVRNGSIVEPDTAAATSAGYFWPYGALNNARFVPDTTAAPGQTAKRIGKASEGGWTNQAARRIRLQLQDVSGMAASGTNGAIVHNSGVLVWNNDPRYSGYRLTIQAQHTSEGYFQIGAMVLGSILAFGRRYSWGRSIDRASNVDLTTGRSGTRRAQVFGPSRRGVEFGWTDGSDVTALRSPSNPDYVLAATSGGEAAATHFDAPLSIEGLVSELYGSATPVVYLPWIERKALGTAYKASHPDLMVYGRIVSDVSIETVQGEEWITGSAANGEIVRTSTIRIEEEV
jgi:hypothetical protein